MFRRLFAVRSVSLRRGASMAWTQDQCFQVFEQYWQNGGAQCPVDRSVLRVQRADHFNGYFLVASCPRCGDGMRMSNDEDPARGTFRAWTESETAGLLDAHFQQRTPECPVCRAGVVTQDAGTFDGTHVTIRCVRCANTHQQFFPRS